MWMMVISTSLSSSMFVTVRHQRAGSGVRHKIAGIQISWLQWFLSASCRLGLFAIIALWLSQRCCCKSHTVKKWQPWAVMNRKPWVR
ncbi:anion permease [Escherichia coli]